MTARDEAAKEFATADVVSAISGRLVGSMDGVYEVLGFLLGRQLWTHELPQAIKEAIANADLPKWLTELDDSEVTPDNWREWLAGIVSVHGDTVTLHPVSWSALREKTPIETAAEVFGADRVIEVTP